MYTDIVILVLYALIAFSSKKGTKDAGVIITCWFALSVCVAELHLKASVTFPIYWVLAGVCCIILTVRGAAIVVFGMGAMFLFQLAMTVDAIATNDDTTTLFSNYTPIAILINLAIMFLTFLHGRGLESVDHSAITGINNHNHSGT